MVIENTKKRRESRCDSNWSDFYQTIFLSFKNVIDQKILNKNGEKKMATDVLISRKENCFFFFYKLVFSLMFADLVAYMRIETFYYNTPPKKVKMIKYIKFWGNPRFFKLKFRCRLTKSTDKETLFIRKNISLDKLGGCILNLWHLKFVN